MPLFWVHSSLVFVFLSVHFIFNFPKKRERYLDRWMDIQTYRHTDIQTYRQIDRQIDRQTDRQTNKQTNKQINNIWKTDV